MKIVEILSKNSINLNLAAESKEDLLNKMIELAAQSGKDCDIIELRREIIAREQMMSTGVGNGIALPHAKVKQINDCIGSFAVLSEQMDFGSIDGMPVSIVFLVAGKENNVGNHIRLLSKISRLLNESAFRKELGECKTPDHILALFARSESND